MLKLKGKKIGTVPGVARGSYKGFLRHLENESNLTQYECRRYGQILGEEKDMSNM